MSKVKSPPPAPLPGSAGRLSGIDVSANNYGNESVSQATATFMKQIQGQKFSFVKATQGTDYTNPDFKSQWKALGTQVSKGNMDLRVAYSFLNAGSSSDGVAQAKAFLKQTGVDGKLPAGTRLALDWEGSALSTPAVLKGAADYIHEKTGTWPIVYTSASNEPAAKKAVPNAPAWVADYGPSYKGIDNQGGKILSSSGDTFGQYSDGSGYGRSTDLDVFNGSEAALKKFAGDDAKSTTKPPTTKPPTTKPPATQDVALASLEASQEASIKKLNQQKTTTDANYTKLEKADPSQKTQLAAQETSFNAGIAKKVGGLNTEIGQEKQLGSLQADKKSTDADYASLIKSDPSQKASLVQMKATFDSSNTKQQAALKTSLTKEGVKLTEPAKSTGKGTGKTKGTTGTGKTKGTGSIPKEPQVQVGSSGPAVKKLQTLLTKDGFSTQGIDGQFGPNTQAAVESYQYSRGLSVDGVVGPQTWKALLTNAPAVKHASGGGSASKAVALAQRYLGMNEAQLQADGVTQPCPDGESCANFVTSMLYKSGVINFRTLNVGVEETSLKAAGWHEVPLSEAKPGDVWMINQPPPGEQHTELVASNDNGRVTLIGSNNISSEMQQISYDNGSPGQSGSFILAPP